MTTHRDVVDRYMDGFRRSDHEQVLACLTDDVTWYLPGHADLAGKEAFDGEIENEAFDGRPTLTVDRYVEEGDTIVIVGEGEGRLKDAGPFRFAFCDVFTFTGELINRVESYVVPLT